MTLRDTIFQTLVERSIKIMTTIIAGGLLAAVAMAQSPRYTVTDLGNVGPDGRRRGGRRKRTARGALVQRPDAGSRNTWTQGQNSQAFGVDVSGQAVGEAETSNPDPKGEDFCGFAALGLPSPGGSCVPFLWQNA